MCKIDWDPHNIISKLSISSVDIANAVSLFGNQAIVKLRGDDCCPGLYYIPKKGLKPNEFAGIDIPCLITNSEHKTDETIMIIGEAPRRGRCGHNPKTPCSLGTPYAIQFSDYPDQCWVYKQIFKGLLDKYNLYLTDAIKFWASQGTSFFNNNDWRDILKDEIGNVSPKMIVTFGRVAKDMLDKISSAVLKGTEIRNILHPSLTNIGRWKNHVEICPCDIPHYVLEFILENQGETDMFKLIKQKP